MSIAIVSVKTITTGPHEKATKYRSILITNAKVLRLNQSVLNR